MQDDFSLPQEPTPAHAEDAYAEFSRRRQAGEDLSFDDFCRQNRGLAGALRILHSLRAEPGEAVAETLDEASSEAPVLTPHVSSTDGPDPAAGQYCIGCGRFLGTGLRCPNPDCGDIPNFYRDVVRRPQAPQSGRSPRPLGPRPSSRAISPRSVPVDRPTVPTAATLGPGERLRSLFSFGRNRTRTAPGSRSSLAKRSGSGKKP